MDNVKGFAVWKQTVLLRQVLQSRVKQLISF